MQNEQLTPSFSPRLSAALRAALDPLADEVIEAIGAEIPEYRRPLEGSFGRGLRAGVRQALTQFVDMLGDPEGPLPGSEVYRALGRGELGAGRRLDALQAAYRLGARISWRRLSAVAREQGADTAMISTLAEAMFAHIERISASSVEGYAQAQAELAGERERRRRSLVARLAGGEPLDGPALGSLVQRAEWPLPGSLAAIACEGPEAGGLAGLIGGEAIAGRIDGVICVLVPDPDAPGRRAQLRAALERAGMRGTLGPSVSPPATALSFGRARAGLALQRRGLLGEGSLAVAAEHLLELMIHHDRELAAELAAERLGPLLGEAAGPGAATGTAAGAQPRGPTPRGATLGAQSGERLLATLRSWLDHGGSVAEVAAELHVHRQTVRYRLGRLRELLGEAMDDPRGRLELDLALRARAARD